MPNDLGLPDWFPDDFAASDEMIMALEGVEDYGSEEGGSTVTQLGLAGGDGILGQLDLAGGLIGQLLDFAVGNEAWRKEKRNAHGQWTRGGASGAVAKRMATAQLMNPGMQRTTMHRVQANRAAAQQAVASRLAEEHARRALDEAKSEVERVTRELQEQAHTEEQRKHRVKLAVHAVLVIGGAVLAAIMAHYDISPVVAAFAGAMPLLGMELTDWKKKL